MSDVNVKSILVVIDPTAEQQPAVEKGATLARRYGAHLELLACDTRLSRDMRMAKHAAAGSAQPFDADLRPLLESLAGPLRSRGIKVTTDSRHAEPLHLAVLEHAEVAGADLIVKDTHHHPLLKRTVITNTDWHLIRGSRVPLLLSKPASWRVEPLLIAAVDPLHPNKDPSLDQVIMKWTCDLARRLEGTAHMAHAYLPVAVYGAPPGALPALAANVSVEILKAEERQRMAELMTLARPYGVDERNIHLQIDSASGMLPSLAAQLHADLVVMGAISRSGLKRLFIGSTAEAVLENLPCDVLVVKTADFAETLPF